MVRRVVLGHAVRLSSCSTARRIHDETERIVAHFTTATPTFDRGARVPVGPLIAMQAEHPLNGKVAPVAAMADV